MTQTFEGCGDGGGVWEEIGLLPEITAKAESWGEDENGMLWEA